MEANRSTYRIRLAIAVNLGIAPLLWACAVLFLLRVAHVFHRFLLKFPGPWAVFRALLFWAAIAAVPALRLVQRRRRLAGVAVIAVGLVLSGAFVLVIGAPPAVDLFGFRLPKNPGTPRLLPPQAAIPHFSGPPVVRHAYAGGRCRTSDRAHFGQQHRVAPYRLGCIRATHYRLLRRRHHRPARFSFSGSLGPV